MLDILKVLFCTPFLLYSCYTDIKTRRVTNKLWLMMLAGSVFFVLYDIMTEGGAVSFAPPDLSRADIRARLYPLPIGVFRGCRREIAYRHIYHPPRLSGDPGVWSAFSTQ